MTIYVRIIPDRSQSWHAGAKPAGASSPLIKPERALHLDEGFQMPPPNSAAAYAQQISRPTSRLARRQSTSPNLGSMQRSNSAQKARSRGSHKRETRESNFQARLDELNSDQARGNTSSDGEGGEVASVTSSFKNRNEPLASAEISVDNIVEGGRRQKAKFESSELPLFVPPQVPAANSVSSVSPQRRANPNEHASPFARPPQRTFSWTQNMQSPQTLTYGPAINANPALRQPTASHGHSLRDRVNAPAMPPQRRSSGFPSRATGLGILPTPDPTIASTISDEDVALQLMRLGDPSNMSHSRNSASTMDDALSGRAELGSSASSDGDGDDEDRTPEPRRRVSHNRRKRSASMLHSSMSEDEDEDEHMDEDDFDNLHDGDFGRGGSHPHPSKRVKVQHSKGPRTGHNISSSKKLVSKTSSSSSARPRQSGGMHQNGNKKSSKTMHHGGHHKMPLSPAPSIAPSSGQARKPSSASLMGPPQLPSPSSTVASGPASKVLNGSKAFSTAAAAAGGMPTSTSAASTPIGSGEEDLSSKPRCQRCRKSKKGCDRQRPCGRCKDAGIGIEGCISEDEGNGRKGRFGRHMGVPVSLGGTSGNGSGSGSVTYAHPADGSTHEGHHHNGDAGKMSMSPSSATTALPSPSAISYTSTSPTKSAGGHGGAGGHQPMAYAAAAGGNNAGALNGGTGS